jgi:hypothetical protein
MRASRRNHVHREDAHGSVEIESTRQDATAHAPASISDDFVHRMRSTTKAGTAMCPA